MNRYFTFNWFHDLHELLPVGAPIDPTVYGSSSTCQAKMETESIWYLYRVEGTQLALLRNSTIVTSIDEPTLFQSLLMLINIKLNLINT